VNAPSPQQSVASLMTPGSEQVSGKAPSSQSHQTGSSQKMIPPLLLASHQRSSIDSLYRSTAPPSIGHPLLPPLPDSCTQLEVLTVQTCPMDCPCPAASETVLLPRAQTIGARPFAHLSAIDRLWAVYRQGCCTPTRQPVATRPGVGGAMLWTCVLHAKEHASLLWN
jgi:hypothetical protein